MKVLVAVKHVVDANVAVRVRPDGSGIDTANAKMAMNPFDEIGVEEALRLREFGAATEVVVASAGETGAIDTIRAGLAMGADRGIFVKADGRLEPLAVARILKAIVAKEGPELVILGKQAIDDDYNQTGQMLSAILDWPIATFASNVAIAEGKATVVREVDGGRETVTLTMPAVVTTDLRLNQPRFATLPGIMKAKRRPIEETSAADLGIDTAPRLTVVKVSEPPPRRPGVKVASIGELVHRLRTEAGVL